MVMKISMKKMSTNMAQFANYPTQLDEIDQWLVDNFGIIPGACSSTENLRYTTARMIAEALWPKCKESLHIQETCKENGDSFTNDIDGKRDQVEGPSRDQVDKLEKAAKENAKAIKTYWIKTICIENFISGANWQKEQLRDLCYQCEKNGETIYYKGMTYAAKQMEKEYKKTIELAEDHAMLAGMVKQEEEMKEKALEVTVYLDDDGYPCIPEIVLFDFDKNQPTAKEGDKKKVYIFKN